MEAGTPAAAGGRSATDSRGLPPLEAALEADGIFIHQFAAALGKTRIFTSGGAVSGWQPLPAYWLKRALNAGHKLVGNGRCAWMVVMSKMTLHGANLCVTLSYVPWFLVRRVAFLSQEPFLLSLGLLYESPLY